MSEDNVVQLQHVPDVATDSSSGLEVEADPPNGSRSNKFLSTAQSLGSKFPGFVLNTIVNFSISSAFTLFTAFVCWLIYFRPYNLRPRLHSAVIVTFDLSPAPASTNVLIYDLSLNMTFLNKRGWSTVHFDHLTTGLYYNGTRIGPSDDTLPSFKLKPEGRQMVKSVLRGRASNTISAAVAEAFARERAQGQFNVNVRVRTTLSYRLFPHKGTYYYEYDCWLQFPPVPGDGTPAFTGGGFKCGVAK